MTGVRMAEVRHLAKGRGKVSSRLLKQAFFPADSSIIMDYEPWNRPQMTYYVQYRLIGPRTPWQTLKTVHPDGTWTAP